MGTRVSTFGFQMADEENNSPPAEAEAEAESIVCVHQRDAVNILHEAARLLTPPRHKERPQTQERQRRSGRQPRAAWGAGPGKSTPTKSRTRKGGGRVRRPQTAMGVRVNERRRRAFEDAYKARQAATYEKRMVEFEEELKREARKRERREANRREIEIDHDRVLKEGNATIGAAVDNLIANTESLKARKVETIHARWNAKFRTLQSKVRDVIESPTFDDYLHIRRIQADKYVAAKSPGTLARPYSIADSYDPFAVPSLRVWDDV